MDPLNRFSDRAGDYANYRPSYPAAAIATILDGLGEPAQLIAADIGAGTGISARLLGDRGLTVWAIEPNAAMQEAAVPHPNVTFRTSTAEQTGLPDQAVDLVTCFQAFHWFDPALSLQEFHRILRSSGRLALVWNDRDQTDAFTAHYSNLVQTISGKHPAEQQQLPLASDVLAASAVFQSCRQHSFEYRQATDLETLLGRARSTSYIPQQGALYEQFVADLTALHTRWADADGVVDLVYCTNVFLAEPSLL